jgi:hypothetical protein
VTVVRVLIGNGPPSHRRKVVLDQHVVAHRHRWVVEQRDEARALHPLVLGDAAQIEDRVRQVDARGE